MVAKVFTTVLTGGPMSRTDIAASAGISAAAVTKAARPLVDGGYLFEGTVRDSQNPRSGRPATPLVARADRCYFVGVKITADEVIGVVVDLQATVRETRHRPLVSLAVDDVITLIGEVVDELLGSGRGYRQRVCLLGVSLAGDIDASTGFVRYSPFLRWHQVALADRLAATTGLDTVLSNDVTALTIAEQWFGAGTDVSSFALVTVGAGIGCGFVVNGAVVTGAHGVAGELGHVSVGGQETPCPCGGTGCVEAIASTSAITARVRSAVDDPDMTFDRIVRLAENDHPAACEAFAEAGHAIGVALATVANLIDPDRIVLSGEGLVAYGQFDQHIRAGLAAQAFGVAAETEVRVRPLPFEEWARGAATVALRRFVSEAKEL